MPGLSAVLASRLPIAAAISAPCFLKLGEASSASALTMEADLVEEASEDEVAKHDLEEGEAEKSPPQSRGKGRGRSRGRGNSKPGTRCKAKDGKKYCAGCQTYLDIAEFPLGKALCSKDWNAARNVESAAKAQGQQSWRDVVKADPQQFMEVIQAYHVRCSPHAIGLKRAKHGAFCITTYREEIRQSQQILMDGACGMMNSAAYVHWAGKPRNGGLDADEAKQKWEELFQATNAITDILGPSAKLARRVAVKVKDTIAVRDLQERAKISSAQERENRKATQEDINKNALRLSQDASCAASTAQGRRDDAMMMAKGAASSSAGDTGGMGTFSPAGRVAALVGDVTGLLAEPGVEDVRGHGLHKQTSEGQEREKDAGEEGEDAEEAGSRKSTPSKHGKAKPQVWFNRDEKVMMELDKHRDWLNTVRGDMAQGP